MYINNVNFYYKITNKCIDFRYILSNITGRRIKMNHLLWIHQHQIKYVTG